MTGKFWATCATCDDEFEVEYEITGGSPATRNEPAEAPDVEIYTDACPNGHPTDADDTMAERAMEDAIEGAGYGDDFNDTRDSY